MSATKILSSCSRLCRSGIHNRITLVPGQNGCFVSKHYKLGQEVLWKLVRYVCFNVDSSSMKLKLMKEWLRYCGISLLIDIHFTYLKENLMYKNSRMEFLLRLRIENDTKIIQMSDIMLQFYRFFWFVYFPITRIVNWSFLAIHAIFLLISVSLVYFY